MQFLVLVIFVFFNVAFSYTPNNVNRIRKFPFSITPFLKVTSRGNALTMSSSTSTQQSGNEILRRIDQWACVKSCGACCKLGPLSERPDLESYLSKSEYQQYVSMIGSDNWCVNFDKDTRLCKIYETRPQFCIVDPVKFQKMYDVEADDLNDFCAFCCRENITDTFGGESIEMTRFEEVLASLEEEDNGEDEDDGGRMIDLTGGEYEGSDDDELDDLDDGMTDNQDSS